MTRAWRLWPALLLGMLPSALAAAQTVTLPGPLSGTLLTAGNNAPAVLMIGGSGPIDRDGNSAGLHGNTYKLLAEGLAAQGVSSLRFDKRGVGVSAPAMVSENDLTIGSYVTDAKAWATALRERTGQSCVWLLGHSEGALVAELLAQEKSGYCGLVLVSGPGRTLAALMRAQIDANPANPQAVRNAVSDILGKLASGQTVPDVPPMLMALFRPSVQPYLISELDIDPTTLLAKIALPVLIMQGKTDIQISPDDAKRLAASNPAAKLVLLPGVNHILKTAPIDRAANVATYADPSLPLAPGIVYKIVHFVHGEAP